MLKNKTKQSRDATLGTSETGLGQTSLALLSCLLDSAKGLSLSQLHFLSTTVGVDAAQPQEVLRMRDLSTWGKKTVCGDYWHLAVPFSE